MPAARTRSRSRSRSCSPPASKIIDAVTLKQLSNGGDVDPLPDFMSKVNDLHRLCDVTPHNRISLSRVELDTPGKLRVPQPLLPALWLKRAGKCDPL